jgi:hypothetical protein
MDGIITFAKGVGFPDVHGYGNDGEQQSIVFGQYEEQGDELTAMEAVLVYAQQNGYPDAVLDPQPPAMPTGITLN